MKILSEAFPKTAQECGIWARNFNKGISAAARTTPRLIKAELEDANIFDRAVGQVLMRLVSPAAWGVWGVRVARQALENARLGQSGPCP